MNVGDVLREWRTRRRMSQLDLALLAEISARHLPFPAIAIDRHWTLVQANAAAGALFEGIDPALLAPPLNVLRLSFHPQGLAPRIVNLGQWRHHVLERSQQQIDESGDPFLSELRSELIALSANDNQRPPPNISTDPMLAVPLELRMPDSDRVMRFISTTTVFSTATSVTVSEVFLSGRQTNPRRRHAL